MHLHLGAGACNARIALVEGRALPPGGQAIAQLVLDAPACALRGDRFILRDQSARRTVAGGIVLDPFGVQRGRSAPSRLAALRAMERPTPAQALAALLEVSPDGVRLDRFEQAWNLNAEEAAQLGSAVGMQRFQGDGRPHAIAPGIWSELQDRLASALAAYHLAHPDSVGATEASLSSAIGLRRPTPAARAALRALIDAGRILREGPRLRLPGHSARLADADAALLARVRLHLDGAGLRPPIVGDLAKALGTERAALLEALDRIGRLGHLVRVAPNRFYLPATVAELVRVAQALAAESPDGSFDAAAYRDRSGIGRNLTIEVLEFLDRSGFTRFARDRRWMTDVDTPPC